MKNRDLIIFSGQSNMQGQTERPPYDLSWVDGAYEYRFATDELVNLRHPVGETLDYCGNTFEWSKYPTRKELHANGAFFSPVDNNANMVPSFAKSYVKKTKRELVAVHTAKGETSIDYWKKGGKGFDMLYKKVTSAIKKAEPERIFFVWLQGESDAYDGMKKDVYKERLVSLYDDLKEAFNLEKIGIILVGRFTMDERDFEIIDAQKEICAENDNFLMLTTVTEKIIYEEKYMNPNARGHYSCDGQELIGKLAAEALGEYVVGTQGDGSMGHRGTVLLC